MGSLDDPKLSAFHDQIQQGFYYSSTPNYQKIFSVLNGMSMPDMLDELYRQTGHINDLSAALVTVQGVNVSRLRAALGCFQSPPPASWDTSVKQLPQDQQKAIRDYNSGAAGGDSSSQPLGLSPGLWPGRYSVTRTLPPINIKAKSTDKDVCKDDDDDSAKAAFDFATGVTANAPPGINPSTYTFTLIYRNFDVFSKKNSHCDEFSFFHEPNISLNISPDPQNKATYQAAFTLFNAHIKRNWGLISPDLEFSVSPQVTGPVNGGTPSGAVQAQAELHVTGKVSITLGSSIGIGPKPGPGDAPDRGSIHLKTPLNADVSVTPILVGTLWHF